MDHRYMHILHNVTQPSTVRRSNRYRIWTMKWEKVNYENRRIRLFAFALTIRSGRRHVLPGIECKHNRCSHSTRSQIHNRW